MKNKIIFSIVVIFLIIFTLVFTKYMENNDLKEEITISIDNCNAQEKSCSLVTSEFKFDVSLDENIYYLKPFYISITTETQADKNVESVKVDFKMKNMNMGVNHFVLKKIQSDKNKEVWKAKALLPICVTGRADWVSEFEVMTKNNKYLISLPVEIKK